MRKTVLTAATAALLTAGLSTPAWAAESPPAPTDVTLSWSDGKIKLTWKDNGEANNVSVIYPDLNEGRELATPAATDPNEVLLPTTIFKTAERVEISVRSFADHEYSQPAPAPQFDSLPPNVPALQDANLLANLSTTLKWKQFAIGDTNPGDPLDVPDGESVKATVDLPGTATHTYSFAPGTTGTVPAQPRPAAIKLSAVNEWGATAQDTKTVRLGTLSAAITVPSKAVYSARLGIKSTVDLFTSEGREERASDVKVELQARAKATDAWKTYGRYTGNTTAAFDTGIASLGNRQYRLLLPARKVVSTNVIALTPPTSTSAKSSTTYVKFASGGFSPTVGRPGTRWTFSSKILPAVTVKGRLQFWDWDSNVWVNGPAAQFTKGSYILRNGPDFELGTIRFRVVVPTLVVNGLTVNANTSPGYNQTIR